MKDDIAQIKDILKPFTDINKLQYWGDLTLTSVIAWTFFLLPQLFEFNSIVIAGMILISALAFYRAMTFTHELAHFGHKVLPWFREYWHLVCGFPLMVPHFLYHEIHLLHHSTKGYNTENDAEYYPFAKRNKIEIILYFFANLGLPVFLLLRFSLLSILSLNKSLRNIIRRDFSSMGIKLKYSREIPENKESLQRWNIEESITTIYCIAILSLLYFEIIPLSLLVYWYLVLIIMLTLNTIRFLGATHIYDREGAPMNFLEQAKDGIVIDSNSLLSMLLCPVGQRYHGLHHIMASIPGLSLSKAHRKLKEELGDTNELYKSITYPSLWRVISIVWKGGKTSDSLQEKALTDS